ncbi:MAG TPA: tetratricopeptide repeat protein [Burkholderiales bacterium]|nr:tetratricopeptide repeat protein [Burkholderiales bacterium]
MTQFPDPRRARAAVAAALLAAGAVLAQSDDVQEASKLLKAGQQQQALERVNKVLAAKPKDAQARFLKGLIYAEQGNAKEATELFLQLTKDYPELPEPYNNLAVIYASQGQYEKARSALEQSIRTHPSYATAYENLGDVYAKLASQAYDKALQIDSANAGAKNKLALVRELVGVSAPAPAVVAQAKPPAPAPAAPPPKEPAKPPVAVATAESKPPVAEKPAEKAPASPSTEVIDTVRAWAKAWSSKDVDAYLAFYAKDFRTPGGEARSAWEKTRRQRINAPKSISVSVEAPKVSVAADGHASVTFRQGYRSDVLKATTATKTLVLVKAEGHWLIQQERVN